LRMPVVPIGAPEAGEEAIFGDGTHVASCGTSIAGLMF
jgi:hypothetical protein